MNYLQMLFPGFGQISFRLDEFNFTEKELLSPPTEFYPISPTEKIPH